MEVCTEELKQKIKFINQSKEHTININFVDARILNYLYDNIQILNSIKKLEPMEILIIYFFYFAPNGYEYVKKIIMKNIDIEAKIKKLEEEIIPEEKLLEIKKISLTTFRKYKVSNTKFTQKIEYHKKQIIETQNNQKYIKILENIKNFNLERKNFKKYNEIFGISRERVRQIKNNAEKKIIDNLKLIGDYEEILMFDLSPKFISENLYINSLVINKYNEITQKKLSKEYIGVFTEEDFFEYYPEYRYLYKHYYIQKNYFEYNKNFIQKDERKVTEYLYNNLKANVEYTGAELFYEYNKMISGYKKPLESYSKNIRALEEKLLRYGLVRGPKYFKKINLTNIDILIQKIDKELDNYPNFLSTKKIYNDFYDEIVNYEIKNEYELHSILKKKKKLLTTSLVFERMPHLSKGVKLNDYLEKEFITNTSLSLPEIINKISYETGIKELTLRANNATLIKKHFINGISVNKTQNEDYIEKIKKSYTDKIYSISEITEDLQKYGAINFIKSGFNFVFTWMIDQKYKSVREFLLDQFDKNKISEFHKINPKILNSEKIKTILLSLRNEIKIFKITNDKYFKLTEQFKNEILSVQDKIEKTLNNKKIMGFKQIIRFIDENSGLIASCGFNEIFYEEIIYSMQSVKYIKDYVMTKEFVYYDIIKVLLEEKMYMTIIEVEKHLKDMYEITNTNLIINKILTNELYFYQKDLDKIFLNRKKFFEYIRSRND